MGAGLDLSAKNILITGGSLGLGFATAEACLRAGGRVVICARDRSNLEDALTKLKLLACHNVEAIAADVTSIKQIEGALDLLESRFGPVTSLVHAAAVQGPIGEITAVDPNEWLETVRVDLFGSFLAVRQTCARMKKSGGRIMLFSGGGASAPLPDFTAYACSKAAVVRLVETVAREMTQYRIEINCLAPGLVATRMAAQAAAAGRAPNVEPVPASLGAEAAAFLISDLAAGISGKFVAAPYDEWRDWPAHLPELHDSDIFTLRRILPRDRGMNWQ
jgi:NAD(P)-dependent dehydrogenase (short-subunit alcohol dehydrogenase family)